MTTWETCSGNKSPLLVSLNQLCGAAWEEPETLQVLLGARSGGIQKACVPSRARDCAGERAQGGQASDKWDGCAFKWQMKHH